MTQQDVAGECIHGLTYAWCALCKAKTATRVRSERSWMSKGEGFGPSERAVSGHPTTMAKYDGSCPLCGVEIEAGKDRIYRCDNEWICAECAQDYDSAGAS